VLFRVAKQTVDEHLEFLYGLARSEPDPDVKKSRLQNAEDYFRLTLQAKLERSTGMIGVASNVQLGRIDPWYGDLNPKELILDVDDVGDILQKQIFTALERKGICQVRITALSPESHVMKSVANLIGPLTKTQNKFKSDTVQLIVPKATGAKNSGNTLADLGLHVDGTQHKETPAVLLFHYVSGAKLGATSVFVDIARALLDIKADRRNQILVNLARHDAAVFSKKGMVHKGPIFYFSETGRLVCRVRFDNVISVHPECMDNFNYIQKQFNEPRYRLEFKPREGDMIIFDNWRVLHARDEVYGLKVRQHWRGWISNLKPAYQPDYFLGIRPFSADLAAKIQSANDPNAV
jgi:alpha-ketoglutarate-dependent taurine dioxygenase